MSIGLALLLPPQHVSARPDNGNITHVPIAPPIPFSQTYSAPAMFSRPVGLAARSASSKSFCIKALPSRAATSQASSSCHQRRNSSSKASHPPGASRGSEAATGPNTAPCSDQTENSQDPEAGKGKEKEKKPATRLSRRKAKDTGAAERASLKARDEAFANLPAVPPTTHLHPGGMHSRSKGLRTHGISTD